MLIIYQGNIKKPNKIQILLVSVFQMIFGRVFLFCLKKGGQYVRKNASTCIIMYIKSLSSMFHNLITYF